MRLMGILCTPWRTDCPDRGLLLTPIRRTSRMDLTTQLRVRSLCVICQNTPVMSRETLKNTGYVIFGQDPQKNIPTDNGRDMHSYSSAPRASNEAQKMEKRALNWKKRNRRDGTVSKQNETGGFFLSVWLVMVVGCRNA